MQRKIILISGKQGSGKTTTAQRVEKMLKWQRGFVVNQEIFASTIYEIHDFALDLIKKRGIERDLVKDGYLLQLLGTEWGRATIDQDIWAKCLKGKIENSTGLAEHTGIDKVAYIISDCRFKNEFHAFPDALRVRLECSEEVRKERCEMWRDTTDHPSECDLDDYADQGLFDLTIDTSGCAIDHAATLIMAQLDKGTWKEKRQ